ncbi:MAG: GNAT family N-acetyltransferase [Actinomycetota bacterium]
MTALEYRSIQPSEVDAFRAAYQRGFGSDPIDDPAAAERWRKIQPLERTVAAFDGDEIVGTLGDFALMLTLPGGTQIPMAGTTEVTVRATHRRRGLLREMMSRHLAMAAERGEPVAGLWASESGIYGRFGFGLATECHEVSVDGRAVGAPAPAEDLVVSAIEGDQLETVVAPFWTAVAASDRAGFVERSRERWEELVIDPERERGGATAGRHVVVHRRHEVVGYLAYRQHRKWVDNVPQGTVEVNCLVGADADAVLALWHLATNIDLFPKVSYWDAPVDDPLASQAADARAVKRNLLDGLYLRILDVPVVLAARRYEHDGELVLEVDDPAGHAAGTYRLTVEAGRGAIERTDRTPDIRLGIRELGALSLGRDAVNLLTSTGLVTGSEAAIADLDRLFRTRRAPWCPEMF